jgi:hypothetical protein
VEVEEEEPVFSNAEALRRVALREGKFDGEGKMEEWEGEGSLSPFSSSENGGGMEGERRKVDDAGLPRKGAAVRRKYWFESLGVVISNLGMF